MKFNYEDTGEEVQGEIPVFVPETDEERKKRENKRIAELQRTVKESNQELRGIFKNRGDPESITKLLSVTSEIAQNVLLSEITDENFHEAPFNTLNEEQMEFYDDQKYKQVHGLHKQLIQDEVVADGLEDLKQTGRLNSQTQWRLKKPNDWIGRVVQAKRNAHNDARLALMEQQIAQLTLAQKETDDKLEQIGNALLVQDAKLEALAILGVNKKKLMAYKMSLDNPELSLDEVAEKLGRHRATVFRWMKEIKELENSCTK